jgi:ferrous iron transport protein B
MPANADVTTIALIGNPNTGKSTIFNALAGVRQRVANYPGVTVEKRTGEARIGDRSFTLIDLPGTYSLAPRSPDEMVAVDVLLGRLPGEPPPQSVLCILDASNLERNLYLLSQVRELGLPTVVALNMMDVAADKGVTIDVAALEERLGQTVLPMRAHRKEGLSELRRAIEDVLNLPAPPAESPFPAEFRNEVDDLAKLLYGNGSAETPRFLVERLLLDTGGYLEAGGIEGLTDEVRKALAAARDRLKEIGQPVPAIEAMSRYGWVSGILDGVITRETKTTLSASDRIDKLLTHRIWGSLVFIGVMILVFQSVFSWAGPLMDGIDWTFGKIGDVAASALPDGVLQSLVVDGVIAGVGGVLVFLPQIMVLFLFIAIMEDCGYMARAAYLMDKLMSRVGLSGKSFIPLLSSFACAIPGVMAARVIENRRDRLATILVAPLMSCSARLPVYAILIAAFIPEKGLIGGWLGLQGITLFAMYALGVVVAIAVAALMKRTFLKGPTPPFVMELPTYRMPSLQTVFYRVADRGWAFVRRAGTLILAASIIVWAAAYFPRDVDSVEGPRQARVARLEAESESLGEAENDDRRTVEEELAEIDNQIQGQYLRESFLGRAGRLIEPAVKPLGWDWKIGCAAIAAFPAREVIVSTLGILYNLGGEEDEGSQPLKERMRNATWADTGEPVYNIPVALSIMVFFALCCQCAATLAVVKRETNSWRWPMFAFAYMTGLAYLAALATYQVGMLFVA